MSVPKTLAWVAQPIIVCAGFFVAQGYLIQSPQKISSYRYALYAFLCVVLLMEFRVLLGERGKRDTFFYVHLMSGVCTIVLLGTLGFRHISPLLEIETVLLSGVSIATGLFLLHRES